MTTLPKGLHFTSECTTPEISKSFLDIVKMGEWRKDLGRDTQQYGYRYDYKSKSLRQDVSPIKGSSIESIVDVFQPSFYKLSNGLTIDQVIVNNYNGSQKIGKHIDSPLFGPVIITYTLGDSADLVFRLNDTKPYILKTTNDCAIAMTNDSRYLWSHETKPIKSGQRRISITFRSVV